MSDHQRSKVYEAEGKILFLAVRLPSADHVRALIKIMERLPWVPEDRRGLVVQTSMSSTHASCGGGILRLPGRSVVDGAWAWTDLVVVHEYAHHLAGPQHGHDDVFTSTVLRLLRDLGRTEVADALALSYADYGVRVRSLV